MAGTIAAVDTNLKSSYLHQYNVMVEQQVFGGSVTVGYVGSKGRRTCGCRCRTSTTRRPAPARSTPRRLLRGRGAEPDDAGHPAQRRRAGLQRLATRLRAAVARRPDLPANYTLAKGMSDVTQPGGGGAQQAYGVDPTRIHELEWSASDIDIRHRYAFALNYELPFGQRRHRRHEAPRRRLAGEPAGLLAERRAVHGLQRHARAATPAPASTAPTRPARACSTTRPSTSGSTPPASSPRTSNTIGNSGRNNLYGPPQRRIDMSIFKDIVVRQPAAAAAAGGLQHHQHAELRGARRRPGIGHLRADHVDGQQHPAAVPVRREIPVLARHRGQHRRHRDRRSPDHLAVFEF